MPALPPPRDSTERAQPTPKTGVLQKTLSYRHGRELRRLLDERRNLLEDRSLTPTMLRTRYHERGGAPAKPSRPNSALPALAPETDEDASDDWLVHVQAGRIAVR